MTLGLTDGKNNYGLSPNDRHYIDFTTQGYGSSVGTDSPDSWTSAPNKTLGLTTDPSNSGLVANLGDVTGITVAIWERTR